MKFYEWACFSSQQAAEKAVKAVFYARNVNISVDESLLNVARKQNAQKGIEDARAIIQFCERHIS